jgi:hypothetical protein
LLISTSFDSGAIKVVSLTDDLNIQLDILPGSAANFAS